MPRDDRQSLNRFNLLAARAVLLGRELLSRGAPFPLTDTITPADVFISPHFDDVCFSLGALAAARRAGVVLTVCSQSKHVENYSAMPADPQELARAVSSLRCAEDAHFAERCGLRQVCLGLAEATLRGRKPFDAAMAAVDLPLFEQPLIEALVALRREQASVRPWLFCPTGIGGHVDHVAIRLAVVRYLRELSTQYKIGFYEDLPYASRLRRRLRAVAALRANTPGLRRRIVRVDAGDKLALVRLYASQFATPPSDLKRFTPALLRPAAPHEAIWTSEPL
jgi:LmbE family N-acetylglucosaminyl deacetylase